MGHFEIILHHGWEEYLTLDELALAADIHPELVKRFVEFGLLDPVERVGPTLFFEWKAVPRLRMIQRLRSDVGVNLPGVAVILDLTDRIRRLQQEVEWLRQS